MKKKILFIADIRNWAYDDAAKNWKIRLRRDYDIDILYLDDFEGVRPDHKFYRLIKEYQTAAINGDSVSPSDLIKESNMFLSKNNLSPSPLFNHKDYDGIYVFYHRALCDSRLLATPIPLDKLAIAINNEKWVEAGAQKEYNTYMKGAKVIVGSNKFIIDSFKNICPIILRASQSIDPSVFKYNRDSFSSKRVGHKMIVGWSGNFNNKIKNFEVVRKGCLMAGVRLHKVKDLHRKKLNEWYNEIDVVVCASKSEGGPLMILEAGAVGLPVISAPVGLAREIIKHNKTGLTINWRQESIAGAVNVLSIQRSARERLGKALQDEVLKNWTYEARLYEIREILKELCK